MKKIIYCSSILPLMQSLLATLADIDFAHECELQQVLTGSADPTVKERVRMRLEARHHERREPYVRQLRVLEARVKADMPDGGQSFARDAA